MAVLDFVEQKSCALLGKYYKVSSQPLENFLYALKATETKRQYPKRLKILFDYFFRPYPYKNNQFFMLKR